MIQAGDLPVQCPQNDVIMLENLSRILQVTGEMTTGANGRGRGGQQYSCQYTYLVFALMSNLSLTN